MLENVAEGRADDRSCRKQKYWSHMVSGCVYVYEMGHLELECIRIHR